MNKKKIGILGAASVVAVALSLSAAPAMAATWDGGNIDWASGGYWSVSNGSFDFGGPFTDEWASNIDDDTFDKGLQVYGIDDSTQIECTTADLSAAADGSGDQILTCDPEDLPVGPNSEVMSVTAEYRFFADNKTVRVLVKVKNTTGAAVSGANIWFYNNFYQDTYTNVEYSNSLGSKLSNWPTGNSSASDVIAETDNIFVTDCPTGTNQCDPSYTGANVMQMNGADAPTHSTFVAGYNPTGGDAAGGNADDNAYFSYALPDLAADAEASVVIMNRTYLFAEGVDDTATGANALVASQDAVAFAEAGGFTCDEAMVGISDPTKILNWKCAASLPDTGVSVAPLAIGAGALMIAGLGLVVALRRRARA